MPTIIKLCEFCGDAFSAPANKPWIRHCSTACEEENASISDYAPPMCDNGCGQPSLPRSHYCGDDCKREATRARKKDGKLEAPARKSWRQKPGSPIPPEVTKLHELTLKMGPKAAALEARITRSALIARLWRYGLSASRQ